MTILEIFIVLVISVSFWLFLGFFHKFLVKINNNLEERLSLIKRTFDLSDKLREDLKYNDFPYISEYVRELPTFINARYFFLVLSLEKDDGEEHKYSSELDVIPEARKIKSKSTSNVNVRIRNIRKSRLQKIKAAACLTINFEDLRKEYLRKEYLKKDLDDELSKLNEVQLRSLRVMSGCFLLASTYYSYPFLGSSVRKFLINVIGVVDKKSHEMYYFKRFMTNYFIHYNMTKMIKKRTSVLKPMPRREPGSTKTANPSVTPKQASFGKNKK